MSKHIELKHVEAFLDMISLETSEFAPRVQHSKKRLIKCIV